MRNPADAKNAPRWSPAVTTLRLLSLALTLGLNLDDDTDGVSQADSDELAQRVGHRGGEETCSALLGEVREEDRKSVV